MPMEQGVAPERGIVERVVDGRMFLPGEPVAGWEGIGDYGEASL